MSSPTQQQHSVPAGGEQQSQQPPQKFGLLLAGIIVIAATMRSPITATGPVVELIRSDTGIGHTMAGLLTSLPLIAFAAVSPFAPRLAKRFGLETALLLAVIIVTSGITLRLLPSVLSLYAGTALLGCGIAFSNVLLPSLIKRDFPLRVGIVTGLYSVSMNMFASISSGISVPVAEASSLGWRASLGVWAILSLLAVFLWLPQAQRGRKQMLYITSQSEKAPTRLRTSSLAWFVTLFMGIQSLIFYTTITWLPEILADQGFSAASAGWMLSLMQMVSVPATFIVPILAGKTRDQRLLTTLTCLCLIVGYALLFSTTPVLVTTGVALAGIGAGASFGLVTMFFVLRTRHAREAASLSGMAQSFGYMLAAGGPLLFGLMHDWTHGWSLPLLVQVLLAIGLLMTGLQASKDRTVS
ncbi:MFS transporter, CP family, cyanate transporter [Paenibacillus polysaccharolyticus]|uniref:MFS transporter, CP family, cyanate transporter n=1 Tax=Paenibacillus polysaccharolyticus TaxID=582692 RepID=A0A1G5HKL4_9BACL|nr:MFS transporter [Paenibacillus polysaccharolyticus]SCY64009.1 MFS transporter, CP family, cyanate transporter [Paenibacillus polysaccharolyticus]